jgi:hypothetical protein
VERDPELRAKLAKEGRLWGLAAVCAAVGALTVALTDAVAPGVLAFAVALAVLGPLLWRFEKRRRS